MAIYNEFDIHNANELFLQVIQIAEAKLPTIENAETSLEGYTTGVKAIFDDLNKSPPKQLAKVILNPSKLDAVVKFIACYQQVMQTEPASDESLSIIMAAAAIKSNIAKPNSAEFNRVFVKISAGPSPEKKDPDKAASNPCSPPRI